jgi:hypothetical protein
MLEIKETKWVIMDKTRTVIAKGVPRDRHLVLLSNSKDQKRILFYNSYNKAKAGYSTGFYSWDTGKYWDDWDLEPVEVEVIIREKS